MWCIFKREPTTNNGPIEIVHDFFPKSPWCEDMKSAEKMACVALINLRGLIFKI